MNSFLNTVQKVKQNMFSDSVDLRKLSNRTFLKMNFKMKDHLMFQSPEFISVPIHIIPFLGDVEG